MSPGSPGMMASGGESARYDSARYNVTSGGAGASGKTPVYGSTPVYAYAGTPGYSGGYGGGGD
jgi:hypothetical protein